MSRPLSKKKKKECMQALMNLYPDARAELDYTNPLELLIATILSAQCTDVRVNKVTPALFERAPNPEAYASMPTGELEELIRTCGLYQSKAKNIQGAAQMLLDEYDGKVPSTREALMRLPGVGRKTANVVLANAFDTPAFAVDTHVFRVANRIGLTAAKNVDETERQLMENIPQEWWIHAHHALILHGRRVCKARSPLCAECVLNGTCRYSVDAVKQKQ